VKWFCCIKHKVRHTIK